MLGEKVCVIIWNKASKLAPQDSEMRFKAALIYNQFGDTTQTLAWLSKALAGGFSATIVRDTPNFDLLRSILGSKRCSKLDVSKRRSDEPSGNSCSAEKRYSAKNSSHDFDQGDEIEVTPDPFYISKSKQEEVLWVTADPDLEFTVEFDKGDSPFYEAQSTTRIFPRLAWCAAAFLLILRGNTSTRSERVARSSIQGASSQNSARL